MRKLFLFTLCFFLFISTTHAQGLLWAKEMNNGSTSSLAIDNAGNIYVCGGAGTTTDLDPGPGVYNLAGGNNYILKLDPNGNFIWAKQVVGQSTVADLIRVDNYGGVYKCGTFKNTADFDPGSGVYNMTEAGNGDAFILKLDSAGNFKWAKRIGNASGIAFNNRNTDIIHELRIGLSGNLYLAGTYRHTCDMDPGPGTYDLTTTGFDLDLYTMSLDSAGNFLWVKAAGITSMSAYFGGLAVDNAEAVYMSIRESSGGGSDGSLTKYNSQGDILWSKVTEWETRDIITDNSCNIYFTGVFDEAWDFDPGPGVFNMTPIYLHGDACIVKLDSGGNFTWAKQLGESSFGWNIDVDDAASVCVAGDFLNAGDYDPGPGVLMLTPTGTGNWRDIFIAKFDQQGNFQNAAQFKGANLEYPTEICIDQQSNILIGGDFRGIVDFDPDPSVYEMSASLSSVDGFIVKLSSALDVNEMQNINAPELSIYPNPSSGDITISSSGTIERLIITDVLGRVVHSSTPGSKLKMVHLDIADGIYNISVHSGMQTVNRKMVLTK